MTPFDYFCPATLAEAENQLTKSDDALLLAGGMTLLPTMKMRLAAPSAIVDLRLIDKLRGVQACSGGVEIAAMTTHAAVATSELVQREIPALARLAGRIGDPQVRNRGTLGGSLANSDPAADYPAAVLGLAATIVTQRREIAADEFFLGMFETALEPGEIITAVRFPKPRAAAYEKFANPASRYAVVGVLVAITDSGVRVAVTGAASCVYREAQFEAALSKQLSPDSLDGIDIDSSEFNSDMHASQEYRASLVSVMAKRAAAAVAS